MYIPERPSCGSLHVELRNNELPHDDLKFLDFFYHALYCHKSKEPLLEGKGV